MEAASIAAAAIALVLPAAVGFATSRASPHDGCDVDLRARGEPAPATFRAVWIATYAGLGLIGARLVLARDKSETVAAERKVAIALWVAVQALAAAWVVTWGCDCDPLRARAILVLNNGVALALALVGRHQVLVPAVQVLLKGLLHDWSAAALSVV